MVGVPSPSGSLLVWVMDSVCPTAGVPLMAKFAAPSLMGSGSTGG